MTPSLDPATDARTVAAVRDMAPLADFTAAVDAVLAQLSAMFDLSLWAVMRVSGDDHVVLSATPSPFGVVAGDVLPWSEGLCSRMVRGGSPRVARRVADVPAYASAPSVRAFGLSAYVGVPLTGPDGELFGTLCGFGTSPSAAALVEGQPLFELQARLLSSVLAAELTAVRAARATELAQRRSRAEPLDRVSWTALLGSEGRRCSPYATPASVLTVEVLDSSEHAARTGSREAERMLRARLRSTDALARTGPASYAVLCPETPEAVAQVLATELLQHLQDGGTTAAVGVAALDPRDGDLVAAWHRAQTDCSAAASVAASLAVSVAASRAASRAASVAASVAGSVAAAR